MEISIFDEVEKKEIAPQNFIGGIFLCVSNIFLSYLEYLMKMSDVMGSVNSVVYIFLLLFFRKYLRNFNYGKSIFWLNWQIGVLIAIQVTYFYGVWFDPPSPGHFHYIALVFFAFTFIQIFLQIKIGLSYIKVHNDFIGLLKPLGILTACLYPLCTLTSMIFTFPGYWEKVIGESNLEFVFLVNTTIGIIPPIIAMVIFYRAMKYQEIQQNT